MAAAIFIALLAAVSIQMSAQAGLRQLRESCPPNDLDGPQSCRCPEGQGVYYIYSYHNNRNEDRAWTLDCRQDINYGMANQYETIETEFDREFKLDFAMGDQVGILSGMSSYHENDYEDRRFKFHVTIPANLAVLGVCRWQVVNNYDEEMRLTIGGDEVISGVHSIHDDHHEDRVWSFRICKINYGQ